MLLLNLISLTIFDCSITHFFFDHTIVPMLVWYFQSASPKLGGANSNQIEVSMKIDTVVLLGAILLMTGVSSKMLDERLLSDESEIKSGMTDETTCKSEGSLKRDVTIGSLSFLTGCIMTLCIAKAFEYSKK